MTFTYRSTYYLSYGSNWKVSLTAQHQRSNDTASQPKHFKNQNIMPDIFLYLPWAMNMLNHINRPYNHSVERFMSALINVFICTELYFSLWQVIPSCRKNLIQIMEKITITIVFIFMDSLHTVNNFPFMYSQKRFS